MVLIIYATWYYELANLKDIEPITRSLGYGVDFLWVNYILYQFVKYPFYFLQGWFFVTSYIVNWISAAKFLVYNGNKIFYNSNQRHLCVIGNNLHNKKVFCRHEMSAVLQQSNLISSRISILLSHTYVSDTFAECNQKLE